MEFILDAVDSKYFTHERETKHVRLHGQGEIASNYDQQIDICYKKIGDLILDRIRIRVFSVTVDFTELDLTPYPKFTDEELSKAQNEIGIYLKNHNYHVTILDDKRLYIGW